MALHPPILWAQRCDVVLITIPLQDATDVSLSTQQTFTFEATSDNKRFSCAFRLFAEVVPEESSRTVRPRQIEIKLRKKDSSAPYWPRLTEDKGKSPFIQIDWNKWKDEDEGGDGSAEDFGDFGAGGLPDMQQLMGQLGAGGSDVPAFGSAKGQQEMNIPENVEDEDMPPLEE
jgi:hypothetical protein